MMLHALPLWTLGGRVVSSWRRFDAHDVDSTLVRRCSGVVCLQESVCLIVIEIIFLVYFSQNYQISYTKFIVSNSVFFLPLQRFSDALPLLRYTYESNVFDLIFLSACSFLSVLL